MVEYKHPFFARSLVAVLGTLIALNVLILLATFDLLALLPIAVLGTVLYAVLRKTRWVRTAVRVWSALLIISGAASLIATFLGLIQYLAYGNQSALAEIDLLDTTIKLALLGIGLAYFLGSKRYIVVDEAPNRDRRAESGETTAGLDDE